MDCVWKNSSAGSELDAELQSNRKWSGRILDPISSRFSHFFGGVRCFNLVSKRRLVLVSRLNEVLEKAVHLIVEISDQWYENAKAVQEFRAKVYELRRSRTMWIANPKRLKLIHILRLTKLVRKELDLLKAEVEFAMKQSGSSTKRKAFPLQLTQKLTSILAIARGQSHHQIDETLARNCFRSAYALPFANDYHYVSYGPVEELRETLADEDLTVLLLWGAAGSGKSMLVRQLALDFRAGNPLFLQVLYLQCGKEPPINQVQRDLLCMLGSPIDGASRPNEAYSEVEFNFQTLNHVLRTRPNFSQGRQHKLLIILDDVRETELLNKLVVESKHVTYLVTSRERNVCSFAKMVEMTHPDLLTARKVMGKYMGGLPQQVESQESKFDRLIRLVDFNPLYLSSVAIFIKNCCERREDDAEITSFEATQNCTWLLGPNEINNTQNDVDQLSTETWCKLVREFVRLAEHRPLSALNVGIFSNKHFEHPWRRQELKYWSVLIQDVVALLSPREETVGKNDAYKHAKLVLIKLIGDKELDDSNMAKLLLDHRTSTLACQALQLIYTWFQEHSRVLMDRSFPLCYVETMTALLKMSRVPASETDVMKVLEQILKLETPDAITDLVDQISHTDEEILRSRDNIVQLLQCFSKLRDQPIANASHAQLHNRPLRIRGDVQSMGFLSFDQKCRQNEVLALYNLSVQQSTTVLRLVFFHSEGMGRMLGVRHPFSEVSVDKNSGVTVRVVGELCWRRYWESEEQLTGFKPIVFEQSERSTSTRLSTQIGQIQKVAESPGYLRLRPSWMTCLEHLFFEQSMGTLGDGQKFPLQSQGTSASEIRKLLQEGLFLRFDVRIILDVDCLTESGWSTVGVSGGPKEIVGGKSRSRMQGKNAGNESAVNANVQKIASGVGDHAPSGAPSARVEGDDTRGQQTSEPGSEPPGSSNSSVTSQQKFCHANIRGTQGVIQPVINVNFDFDPVGKAKFVQANVCVDFPVNCNSDAVIESMTMMQDGFCQCQDKFYVSFGCKDDSVNIEMDSRHATAAYDHGVESQAGTSCSQSSKTETQVEDSTSAGKSKRTEQFSIDRETDQGLAQGLETSRIDEINGSPLENSELFVLPTHFKDYLSYTVSSEHRHDPENYLRLTESDREKYHHGGTFGSVRLHAGAKWAVEEGEKGEHTWAFEAGQARLSYAVPTVRSERKSNRSWISKFRRGRQSESSGCEMTQMSESQQKCSNIISIDYDFFAGMDSAVAECSLQSERNGKHPQNELPVWSIRTLPSQ